MKKRTLSLIIVGAIVAALLVTVVACVIVANSQNDKRQPTDALSDWMGMIRDDALLKNIAIPGAHDAGTKGISYLGETQDRDTAALLACGTRYLDLRVTKAKDQLKIFHGPFKGVTLDSVLSAVKQFVTQHPTETVILDFQHFGGDAEKDVCAMIGEKLQGLLVTADTQEVTFVNGLTLGAVRGKVLVVWGDNYDDVNCNYVFKRNDDNGNRTDCVIHSYYQGSLNRKGSTTYIKTALPHYIDLYKQENSGLFVLQGQLTDGLFVFGPHFREATHNKNMNNYLDGLSDSGDLSIANIVIRDFVCPAKNCHTLQLNVAKGLVKSASTAAYNKLLSDNK